MDIYYEHSEFTKSLFLFLLEKNKIMTFKTTLNYKISVLFLIMNYCYSQNIKILENDLINPKIVNAPKSGNVYSLTFNDEKIIVKKWGKEKSFSFEKKAYDIVKTVDLSKLSELYIWDFTVDSNDNIYLFILGHHNLLKTDKIYLLKFDGLKWTNISYNINQLFKNVKTRWYYPEGSEFSNIVVDNTGNYFLTLNNRVFTCTKNNLWIETDIYKSLYNKYLVEYIKKDANGNVYIIVEAYLKVKPIIDNAFELLYNGHEYSEKNEINIYYIVYKWENNKWKETTSIKKVLSEDLGLVLRNNPIIENEMNVFFPFVFENRGELELVIFGWNGNKWNYTFVNNKEFAVNNCDLFFYDNQINVFTKRINNGNRVILKKKLDKFEVNYEFPDDFSEVEIMSFNCFGENILIDVVNEKYYRKAK